MVTIKSEREISFMREAGKIVALAHAEAAKHIKPGISTYELDQIVEKTILSYGAIPSFKNYNGFPAASCISVNDAVVHGIPSKQQFLKEGDLVSVDIGAIHKGYHGDSAWTYACGEVSDVAKHLMKVTEQSLFTGLEAAKAGTRLSDVSHAIQTYAEAQGCSVVREFVGHGIGKVMHEEPQIPNFGLPGRGITLRPGMTLAIEPMINAGKKEVKILPDGWTTLTQDGSLSAHYEHTILITLDGYEILTKI